MIIKQLHFLEPKESSEFSRYTFSSPLLEFQKHEQRHRLCSYMWSRGREVKMFDIHMICFRGHGIVLHLIYHRITSPDLRLLPEKVVHGQSRNSC